MNSNRLQKSGLALSMALALVSSRGWAQSAPPASNLSEEDLLQEETIVLSPFVVDASEDDGYRATNTLAGTRIRTELKDVGSAVSVVTAQFLQDIGARNSQDLLVYTTNTEVGGTGGNFAGLGNGQLLDDTNARMAPHTNNRVRGLSDADNTRDFFITDIPWDTFNVGRIDLQRGPNSVLFGMGKPAGIINASINGASFKSGGQVEARVGSNGSIRGSLDYNYVIQPDELAVRVSALDDHTKYRQRPAYNRDQRFFGALRFDPQFLRRGNAQTSLKINYESGQIEANRPRTLPPGDLITPWWTDPTLRGVTLNPAQVGETNVALVTAAHAAGNLGMGVRQSTLDGGVTNPNYNPRIGSFGRNYGGIVAVFADPASGASTMMTTDLNEALGLGIKDGAVITDKGISGVPWTIMSGVIPFKDYVGAARNPDGSVKYADTSYGLYKNYVLQDATVFDFYNNLVDGPNKREWSNHDALNISLAQTFWNNRAGLEAVYDRQNYDRGQANMMSEFGQALTLDMNTHLPDGSVNPNFGRACIISDVFANNSYASSRDATRLTGFAEVRFDDFMPRSWFSRALGRHVFTGLHSRENADTEQRNWFRSAADATFGSAINDPLLRNRGVNTLTYLGPRISDRSSISGAHLPRLTAVQNPHPGTVRFYDSTYKAGAPAADAPWTDQYGNASTQAENPANYVGWVNRPIDVISDAAGDRESLIANASLRRVKVKSTGATWQAYLWDGVVVPTVGTRTDEARSFSLNQGPKNASGDETIDVHSPDYRLPDEPDAIVSDRSTSWSVVVHTPQFLRDKLPGHTNLSLFYNKSDNFQPAAGRVDAVGNFIPPPLGETKDYGFAITTWEDRLTFKVNRYKTTVSNDALSAFSGDYMLPAVEAWGYMFARQNLERTGSYSSSNNGAGGYTPVDASQTVADAQAIGDAVSAAFIEHGPSDAWYTLWGIDRSQWNAWMNWTTPQGFTITGDTMSKGTEYEVALRPVPNWNFAINASRTSAQRTNMAESMAIWVEDRWAVYNTPVVLNGQQVGLIGDVRFWGPDWGGGNETARGKFGREFMAPYTLYRIQENSDVPELRPWRFNFVTNYSFSDGFLKHVNVGLGVRWQDEVVTGYKLQAGAAPTDPKSYDLENPYMGPSETNVDAWFGYQRQLTEKINWRVQLNLRNIGASRELIPVTVQPDGSMAVGRIPELSSWTLTNTFSF